MSLFLVRPFQDRPTGRTGYTLHRALPGTPATAFEPATAGRLQPVPHASHRFWFFFGTLPPEEFESMAAWRRWMARAAGHTVQMAA